MFGAFWPHPDPGVPHRFSKFTFSVQNYRFYLRIFLLHNAKSESRRSWHLWFRLLVSFGRILKSNGAGGANAPALQFTSLPSATLNMSSKNIFSCWQGAIEGWVVGRSIIVQVNLWGRYAHFRTNVAAPRHINNDNFTIHSYIWTRRINLDLTASRTAPGSWRFVSNENDQKSRLGAPFDCHKLPTLQSILHLTYLRNGL